MLSTSVIKNSSDASHYYASQDNYYTKEEGIEQSEWWGRGAAQLNLSGEVKPQPFTSLLEGKLPNGDQLGKREDGKIKHRAGWDLTFSAPKSVSIMALVGGDKRLIDAHRHAVSVALTQVEQSCSEARIKIQNNLTYQNTANLVAALYHHDLSREQDPLLHTHSVVMNMTERQDGQWRSQASKMGRYDKETRSEVHGFIERVRHNKRYFGKLYEAELAYQVKELGYEITVNSKTGVFEIVGVPLELNQFFSKRREKIEQYLAEKGLSGGRASDIATINTRENKKSVDRNELTEQWQRDAERLGLNYQKLIEDSQEKINALSMGSSKPDFQQTINPSALILIQEAAKELSVFHTIFSLEKLVTQAANIAIREKINVDHLLQAVSQAIQTGDLLTLITTGEKTVFMSKTTLEDEKRIQHCLQDQKPLSPARHMIPLDQQQNEVPPDMKEAVEELFSINRYVLIEGFFSKEILLKPMISLARSHQLDVRIVSPTQINSKTLAENLKPEPTTLWGQVKSWFVDTSIKQESVYQFLSSKESRSPDLLLVDNSHLLSAKETANLLEWGQLQDTKLIFLANKRLLTSQKTSVTTEFLINHGIKTLSVSEKQSAIVSDITERHIKSLVSKISDKIVEVKESDDRLYAMATHFSKLLPSDRENSFLIGGNKSSIKKLNELAHLALKNNGSLKESIIIPVLEPIFLSEATARKASTYQKDSIVRFNDQYKSIAVERGDYLRVVSISIKDNSVLLQKANGKEIIWQPDKAAGTQPGKVELFKENYQEFCSGERIVLTRSIRSSHSVKSERFTIHSIHHNKIKLLNQRGKSILLDTSQSSHQHFDYGYASNPHAITYEKPSHLIAEFPIKAFHTDQRRFYQVVSEVKNEAWVYTDDTQQLASTLEKKSGDRLSAQVTLQQAADLKNNLHSIHTVLEKHLSKSPGVKNGLNPSKMAINAVDYAIHHLAEREAGFTHKELMFTAMQQALGEVSPKAFSDVSIAMEKAGILLRGHRADGTLWTTADAVKMEREIVMLAIEGKGQFEPIATDETIEKYASLSQLNSEQLAAVKAIIQSRDRVITIEGRAGTGKTTLLATVAHVLASKEVTNNKGYELLGLAPTHEAVKELKNRDIPAQTLDSFILGFKKLSHDPKPFNHTFLVIDESSMVSNRKMLEVLQIARDFNFRGVIPIGDTRQLFSIEAGRPKHLIQRRVKPIRLDNIRRQENDLLKKAVKETYDYDFAAALNTLKDSTIEIGLTDKNISHPKNWQETAAESRLARVEALVNDYFSYSKELRTSIQIITPGHEDRVLTNTLIRDQLKQEGTLIGKEVVFPILSSVSMTRVGRSHSKNFRIGQVLRFNQNQSGVIKANEYLTILQINHDHGLLMLKSQDGREVAWQVPQSNQQKDSAVEVFNTESRCLQNGDVIRWSRTDHQKGTHNSEMATVVNLEEHAITVKQPNEKLITLDGRDPHYQHWDHGYALTLFAAQGKTKQIVLALLESYRENLINQPAFLVALTRAVDTFRIYTDNVKALLERIQDNRGVKLSSLEVIGKYPALLNRVLSDLKTSHLPNQSQINLVFQPISEEKINSFAKNQMGDTHQKDRTHLASYEQMTSNHRAVEPDKTVTKEIQIEREI